MNTKQHICGYCREPFHPKSDRSSFCSQSCRAAYMRNGLQGREIVPEVNPANRKPQPKGCKTVEEFFANGGYAYRLPAVTPT